MNIPLQKQRLWIFLGTVILWTIGVGCHASYYVHSVLSGPPSPDLYANGVGFQLVAFALARLPVWLLSLVLLLVAEFWILGRSATREPRK